VAVVFWNFDLLHVVNVDVWCQFHQRILYAALKLLKIAFLPDLIVLAYARAVVLNPF